MQSLYSYEVSISEIREVYHLFKICLYSFFCELLILLARFSPEPLNLTIFRCFIYYYRN